jgi:hypothetical protein
MLCIAVSKQKKREMVKKGPVRPAGVLAEKVVWCQARRSRSAPPLLRAVERSQRQVAGDADRLPADRVEGAEDTGSGEAWKRHRGRHVGPVIPAPRIEPVDHGHWDHRFPMQTFSFSRRTGLAFDWLRGSALGALVDAGTGRRDTRPMGYDVRDRRFRS